MSDLCDRPPTRVRLRTYPPLTVLRHAAHYTNQPLGLILLTEFMCLFADKLDLGRTAEDGCSQEGLPPRRTDSTRECRKSMVPTRSVREQPEQDHRMSHLIRASPSLSLFLSSLFSAGL